MKIVCVFVFTIIYFIQLFFLRNIKTPGEESHFFLFFHLVSADEQHHSGAHGGDGQAQHPKNLYNQATLQETYYTTILVTLYMSNFSLMAFKNNDARKTSSCTSWTRYTCI